MPFELPPSICFRVTRYCNARCGFCLAPPDGVKTTASALTHRLDWLLAHGVRRIHFCGGEPTLHPALPQLLRHVSVQGGKVELTTNAAALSDLHQQRTQPLDAEQQRILDGLERFLRAGMEPAA